jgi:L-alanine-DL-glutamate epimerase-like enolase superfamily enzyme
MAGVGAASYLEFPWDPPEWTLQRRDFMLSRPLDVDGNGDLVLTEAPGLGFELDEAMLSRTLITGDTIKSNN